VGDVNGESVSNVAIDSSFESYINLVGFDDLDVAENFLFAAEVQHVLSLLNATNEGADEGLSSNDQVEGRDSERGSGGTDQNELTVNVDGLHQGTDVVISGDGVNDPIKAFTSSSHSFLVSAVNKVVSTETADCFVLLGSSTGNHGNVSTHGNTELHGH
jgi:hypothetical protein